jgi:hypothetical protein
VKRAKPASALRHPLHAGHEEIVHLVDVAERGESAVTPAVILGGLALLLVPLAAAMMALAFTAGDLASRGGGRHVGTAPAHVAATPRPC